MSDQHTCHDMNPPFPYPCAECEREQAEHEIERLKAENTALRRERGERVEVSGQQTRPKSSWELRCEQAERELTDVKADHAKDIDLLQREQRAREQAPDLQVDDSEFLGRLVRWVWVEWARTQPNPKASWLVPWEDLSPQMQDVDRRIGMKVSEVAASLAHREIERLRALIADYEQRPWPGCRRLSLGDACECSLCQRERDFACMADARIKAEREREEARAQVAIALARCGEYIALLARCRPFVVRSALYVTSWPDQQPKVDDVVRDLDAALKDPDAQ